MQSATGTSAGEILKRDPEFKPHLESLGLESVEEYTKWCARNGFSVRLAKHWHERCKERYVAKQSLIKARLARKKAEKRKPQQTIQGIFDNELDESSLTQPHLVLIHTSVKTIDNDQARDAFQRLLLLAENQSRLLTMQPAFPKFGAQHGNTFIEGLLGLAYNHRQWIRPLGSWKPRSHNVRRQFSSLASHLLARFPVPAFMESAWFQGKSDDAREQQRWYQAIAAGQSPRSLGLPAPLTKRMAHHFLKAPKQCSIHEALRWGQVRGLGGNGRLIQAIIGSRMGTSFEHNDFWTTVIRWLINNPMLDPAQVGPLIDYVHRQKFEPREAVSDISQTEIPPPQPEFSMKGRTAAALLRQMRQWHAELREAPERPQLEWTTSGLEALDWTEGILATHNLSRWTILELMSRRELYHEGNVMRHCVASYDNSCAYGGTSIWSMGVERNLGRRKRVLTIEVANHKKTICQIRGKANRLANQKEMNIVRRWASQEKLTLAEHIRSR